MAYGKGKSAGGKSQVKTPMGPKKDLGCKGGTKSGYTKEMDKGIRKHEPNPHS